MAPRGGPGGALRPHRSDLGQGRSSSPAFRRPREGTVSHPRPVSSCPERSQSVYLDGVLSGAGTGNLCGPPKGLCLRKCPSPSSGPSPPPTPVGDPGPLILRPLTRPRPPVLPLTSVRCVGPHPHSWSRVCGVLADQDTSPAPFSDQSRSTPHRVVRCGPVSDWRAPGLVTGLGCRVSVTDVGFGLRRRGDRVLQ